MHCAPALMVITSAGQWPSKPQNGGQKPGGPGSAAGRAEASRARGGTAGGLCGGATGSGGKGVEEENGQSDRMDPSLHV